MRIFLSFLLLAGLASSAILERTKTNWDDDDSMTLPSSTSPSPKVIHLEEDKDTNELQPNFISLIPKENTEPNNYEYHSDQSAPREVITGEDESSSAYASPSSEEISDSEGTTESENDKRELPKTHLMQLGKIPLKLKVIPLLPPEEEERQNEPTENTKQEELVDESKKERDENENEHKSGEELSDDVIRIRDMEKRPELPHVPLTYLVPPRMEAQDAWKQLPEANINEHQESFINEDTHPSSYITPTTSFYPLIERINDFLQKAKRHSLEQRPEEDMHESDMQTLEEPSEEEEIRQTTPKEMDDNHHQFVQDDSDEFSPSVMSHTTETSEKMMDDFTPSPRVIDFAPHYPDQSLVNIPRPQRPRPVIPDYAINYPGLPSILPYRQNVISPHPMTHNYPNYNTYNYNLIRPSPTSPIYSNPSVNVLSPPVNQLRGESYVPRDSYWLRKYLYPSTLLNSNEDVSSSIPFSNYFDDSYRPQRNNLIYPTSSAIINEIPRQRETPFVPSTFPYSSNRLYGNLLSQRSINTDLDQLYYPPTPSYQRPVVSYRSYNSYPLINDLMYAPTYSYQKYNSLLYPNQPAFY